MTTPSKPDLAALADLDARLRNCSKVCVYVADERGLNHPYYLSEEEIEALRHLASQPSSYEAGQRDMQERAISAQPCTAENPNEDSYQRGRFDGVMEYAHAIAALPVDGGEVEQDDAMHHLANLLYFLADVHPDDRNDALDAAVEFFNSKAPQCQVKYSGTGYLRIVPDPVVPATPSTAGSVREALEPTRHHYSPDYQAMGDCRVCGHTYDSPLHIGSPADHVASHSVGRSPTLSAPVEAPVAWRYDWPDGACSFYSKRPPASILSSCVPLYAAPRPLPSVDEVAETIWRAEYLRATGRDRSLPWAEAISECDRNRYRFVATAILTLLGGSAHGR